MPDRIRNTRGVFVGYAFHLRAVDVLFLKRYLPHVNKKTHHLGEEFVDGILQVLAAEAVDGAERWSLTAAEARTCRDGCTYLRGKMQFLRDFERKRAYDR